jgi:hypothetical protein
MAHDHKHERDHDVSHLRNAGGAHEHRDINVRAILGFLVTLTVATLVVQLGLWGMFNYLRGAYKPLDPEPNPMLIGQQRPPATAPVRDFPQPRLQADPVHDLNQQRLADDKALHGSPVWLDEQAGVVRIPIDQAMRLTLERGLPTRPQATTPSAPSQKSTAPATGAASHQKGAGKQ